MNEDIRTRRFDLRLEHRDHTYTDLKVQAMTLNEARGKAVDAIRTPFVQVHWRGAIGFVDHLPRTASPKSAPTAPK